MGAIFDCGCEIGGGGTYAGLKLGEAAFAEEGAPPRGLSMQMPPTPLTDCSHIDRLEKLQSSDAPSEYCAQYG
jgi:hypothetical protein